jgi:hypothetical protein
VKLENNPARTKPVTEHKRERALKSPARGVANLDEIRRLVQANETTAAIKLYQQKTGVGLRQAIDAVNRLRAEREK